MLDIINTWGKKEFLQVMSDAFKEAYGVRPRGVNYYDWTLEELKEEFLELYQTSDDNEPWDD